MEEAVVRKLATKMGDLQIVTGTMDALKSERKEVWVWRFEGVKVEVVRDGGCFVK